MKLFLSSIYSEEKVELEGVWVFLALLEVVQLLSRIQFSATPWTGAYQAPLSFNISLSLLKLVSIESVMSSNYLILSSPSPPALTLSQHQSLLQLVSCSHQVAKLLEFQHQSFQWIFRAYFLWDWVVWSYSPGDSEESSPALPFKSINSLVLSQWLVP